MDVLEQPEFREDKIDLAKKQISTGIARRNDDPMGIARREAAKLAYGSSSPYARVAEYATVAAVTREDLLNWHRTYVHPNNIILGVVGDFDPASMETKLRQAFASWPKGPQAKKAEVAFAGPKPGVYFVQKDDVNQSNIRMVDLGTTRNNPDYYALEVFNEIFGGGFTSRLFADVRTKKGLAYGVGGGVGAAYDHPGLFQISMGTKSGTTAAAIDALYEEIDGLEKNPINADELKKAKELFRLQLRLEREGPGGAHGVRVLRLPRGLPRALSGRDREGDSGRRGAGGASLRSQGATRGPCGRESLRFRPAAFFFWSGDGARYLDTGRNARKEEERNRHHQQVAQDSLFKSCGFSISEGRQASSFSRHNVSPTLQPEG